MIAFVTIRNNELTRLGLTHYLTNDLKKQKKANNVIDDTETHSYDAMWHKIILMLNTYKVLSMIESFDRYPKMPTVLVELHCTIQSIFYLNLDW